MGKVAIHIDAVTTVPQGEKPQACKHQSSYKQAERGCLSVDLLVCLFFFFLLVLLVVSPFFVVAPKDKASEDFVPAKAMVEQRLFHADADA